MAVPPRFPLPWWLVLDFPAMRTAPGGVYRAVLALGIAYWSSGCAKLSLDDVTVATAVRSPISAYRQHKAEVLAIWADMRPALDKEHAAQLDKRMRQREHASGMVTAAALKRAAKQSAQVMLAQPTRADPRGRQEEGPAAVVAASRKAVKPSGTTPTYTD